MKAEIISFEQNGNVLLRDVDTNEVFRCSVFLTATGAQEKEVSIELKPRGTLGQYRV